MLLTRPPHCTLKLPGSKSLTNRALLLAALADGETTIEGLLISEDTQAALNCLTLLGVDINVDLNALTAKVYGKNGHFSSPKASLYCHDSGTLLRFLVPICAGAGGHYHFSGSTQLTRRPLKPLLNMLESLGCKFSFDNKPYRLPFRLSSKGLHHNTLTIETNECSQFLSGLLLAMPLAKSPIIIENKALKRLNFVEMTQAIMKKFGVDITVQGSYYTVMPIKYSAVHKLSIEPDASTASYFWALATILAGSITVSGLDATSLQGELKFLDCLNKMGCKIDYKPSGISVTGPKILHGIDVDMQHYSDTFMSLAAIAPFAKSPTTITNIGHTRVQESDRLHAMAFNLRRLNVKVETGDDWMRIYPSTIVPAKLKSFNDHRIVMSLALIGAKIGRFAIDGVECVAKTCPSYFELLQKVIHHA